MKRILILTASFGEGHNTAARSLRDAIMAERPGDVDVLVSDLYQKTNPRLNRALQSGYSVAINRFTTLWRAVFALLSLPGLLELTLPLLGHSLRRALEQQIKDFQPDAIVSTYPVYSFLLARIRKDHPELQLPLITVVTDSSMINSAWYRCPSTHLVVADEPTARALREDGVAPETIQVFGFPVSLRFEELTPLPTTAGPPWKILYLPSSRRQWTTDALTRILAVPDVEVTVVTGKLKGIHQALEEAGFARTPRVRLIGWTDQMPALLEQHHVVIGKAGGAIVQESIAAGCPFIVSHVVPGQEEGNIELITKNGFGDNASASPQVLANSVARAFANDAAVWRGWKQEVARIRTPAAARQISRFVWSLVEPTKNS